MNTVTNFLSSISTRTWIIIAIVLIIIILIIYYSNKKKTVTTTTTSTMSSALGINSINFPLQIGSRGDNVKKWQKYLNTKGAGLVEDGIWGVLTEAASVKYVGFNSVSETYFKGLGI